MNIRLKFIFFLTIGFLLILFLYIQREILTPFIFAAIFAYILNPVVNILHKRLKVPRTISVIVIYTLIIGIIIGTIFVSYKRVIDESSQLKTQITTITKSAKTQINTLPQWVRPTLNDAVVSLEKSISVSVPSVYSFVPQIFSRIITFIIFLFAAFYFLKEGGGMFDRLLNLVPNRYKIEVDILLKKINSVLGSYLRGQIFLVILVSFVLFICLTIIGVRYALILAIFSGFAEIVPIIGPIFAAGVAALVAYFGGNSNLGLDPLQTAIVVVIVYTVVRQIQDYLINPHVMGRITKLHPLIILFAVIAGEHVAGITGLLLAVPIAGILKITIEYSLELIEDREIEEKYK
ncbi:MAG: AI-2E family transporter [Candidatus Levybacteria bacterium]|nr:AI-2E family transporter [Candidatus Levybacteria bacterium]